LNGKEMMIAPSLTLLFSEEYRREARGGRKTKKCEI